MASSNQNETNIESSHLLSSVAMITYIAWIKDKLIEEFDEMTEKIEYERGQIQHNETWKEEYEHEFITEGKWVVGTFLCRWDIFMSKIDIKNSTPFDLRWGGSFLISSLLNLPLCHEPLLVYIGLMDIYNSFVLS